MLAPHNQVSNDYETPVVKMHDLSAVRETMREALDEDEDEDDDIDRAEEECKTPERATDLMPLTSGCRSSAEDSSSRAKVSHP